MPDRDLDLRDHDEYLITKSASFPLGLKRQSEEGFKNMENHKPAAKYSFGGHSPQKVKSSPQRSTKQFKPV